MGCVGSRSLLQLWWKLIGHSAGCGISGTWGFRMRAMKRRRLSVDGMPVRAEQDG